MIDITVFRNSKLNSMKKEKKYYHLLEEGIEIYNQFKITANKEKLRRASEIFFESLHYNKMETEPYIFLSMIFLIFNEVKSSKEFFDIAFELHSSKNQKPHELLEYLKQMFYFNAA